MPILRINNFHNGLTSSQYSYDGAFYKAVNLDVFSQRGICRINYLPIQETTDVLIGDNIPLNFAKNPDSATDVYATTTNSRVLVSTDSGDSWSSLATNKGGHCIVWKDHLFVAGTTALNSYGPLSGTPAWNSFQTLNNTTEHFMFHSKNDDKLYICNGKDANGKGVVASLEQKSGQNFDDGTSATYTWTGATLLLPEGYAPRCITEQRESLLIGTMAGNVASPLQSATIFVWDREKVEYDYPVLVPEGFVNSMLNVANQVYVSAGSSGNIYLFSDSGLIPFAQIPFDYDGGKGILIGGYGHQGLAAFKEKIIVGAFNSATGNRLSPTGLYILDPETRKISHGFLPSTGEDGSSNMLYIGGVYAFDKNTLLFGYCDDGQDTAEQGRIDRILDSNNRWPDNASGNPQAYFETPIYKIGTSFSPVNFQQIDIQLARVLQTGEEVIVKYKKNGETSWTTISTFDYTNYGAVSSFKSPVGIQGIEILQLRVELTTGSSSTNTPYLQEISLQ